jgi:hypothetical protein
LYDLTESKYAPHFASVFLFGLDSDPTGHSFEV